MWGSSNPTLTACVSSVPRHLQKGKQRNHVLFKFMTSRRATRDTLGPLGAHQMAWFWMVGAARLGEDEARSGSGGRGLVVCGGAALGSWGSAETADPCRLRNHVSPPPLYPLYTDLLYVGKGAQRRRGEQSNGVGGQQGASGPPAPAPSPASVP